jgi:hypothetical protein
MQVDIDGLGGVAGYEWQSDSAMPQQAVVFPRAAMQIGRTAQVPIEVQLGPYQSTVNIITSGK